MKKRIAIAALALLLAAGTASANIMSFKVNYVVPRLTGDFWDIEFQNMSLKKTNFQDTSFSLFYEAFLTREFSLVLGMEAFSKNKGGYYKEWVGLEFDDGSFAFPASDFQGDFNPSHSIAYSVTPIQLSVKFAPFGRRGRVIPYIGGGVNATIWSLRMSGDIIDFNDELIYEDAYGEVSVYPIYSVDAREGDGLGKISFGWQAFGGVMIPIANRLTIDVGGQYMSANGKFTQGFEGFQPIDLGGFHISLGINYWF
jgi:opacity protein-like surface antigen